MNLIGDLLREEMETRKMSQREFAKLLDVSLKGLQNWLHPEETPRLRTSSMIKLSHALSIDIGTIADLASPGNTHKVSASSIIRARNIDKLPADAQASVDALIMFHLKAIDEGVDDEET